MKATEFNERSQQTRQCQVQIILRLLRAWTGFWPKLALGIFITLSVADCFAAPASPQLSIGPAVVRQEGTVIFSPPLLLGTDNRTDFPASRFAVGQTDDQSFRLYVDYESIQQLRFNAFTFTSYLSDVRGASPKTFRFQMTGSATGPFRDSPVPVPFHLVDGTTKAAGSIIMPVYSATKQDLIVIEEQKGLNFVSLSEPTPIQIYLGNVADVLSIVVTDVSADETCPKCWTGISSAISQKNPLTIDPGAARVPLHVDFRPDSVPALRASALVIQPDVPHDTVTLTVTYHTVPGGAERRQYIPLKIRFNPAAWALSLALFLGVILGLGARYLLTRKLGKDDESARHAIVAAFVFAIIAEVVGVLITSYSKSQLVLFDLNLDPRQVFPTAILAMLVSGGSTVVAWIRGLFGGKS